MGHDKLNLNVYEEFKNKRYILVEYNAKKTVFEKKLKRKMNHIHG